jgi:hypothetical protein
VNGDDLTPQFRQVGRGRKNKMFTKLKVSKSFPKSQFFPTYFGEMGLKYPLVI